MPTIYDNIETTLVHALKDAFQVAYKADICVGYFNLRGWNSFVSYVDQFRGGEDNQCRLIIGMQQTPQELIQRHYNNIDKEIDLQTAAHLKRQLAEDFRTQLTLGIPTARDEQILESLAAQLRAKKLVVKLFVEYQLHAKLYLIYQQNRFNPILSFLGSSNLTLAGLGKQGELNIDVMDKDAAQKLSAWFADRWEARYCLDISEDLIAIITEGWVAAKKPYYVYLKMVYHLSQEARTGSDEFSIPAIFDNKLLEFQKKAVAIAAHYLNKRGGVLIGDVVGLGKTLVATAVAKLFEEDFLFETLIICPKNLIEMWEGYIYNYQLHAKVLSISKAKELRTLRRYRLVIIDESHNLRNRSGKIYQIVKEYLKNNTSKVILLSATPYNKSYRDLAGQLGLFLEDHQDLGITPERFLKEIGGAEEFSARYPFPLRSLAAFAESNYADDWRELMRLYLVRRTRGFIIKNYAKIDPVNKRTYLTFADQSRLYFPKRIAKKIEYHFNQQDQQDQYAKLYAPQVLEWLDKLNLPRYGLVKYLSQKQNCKLTQEEQLVIKNLTRTGKRLKGFARINLFKRLESGGYAFLLSVHRQIMRNYVYIYALEKKLDLPIGQQENELLDMDSDLEPESAPWEEFNQAAEKYMESAEQIYQKLDREKFDWIRSALFTEKLSKDLIADAQHLHQVLKLVPHWLPTQDWKLHSLAELITRSHPEDKLLIFTQFADTAEYLARQLEQQGITKLACVTGDSVNPTETAQQFSPKSNNKEREINREQELRVLITTDVLSEGQNLQDAHIIVNYDLPWAIIRLIQRAGRVDRIGQQAAEILCYSFLPEDGINNIINLRGRLQKRIEENAEVIGSDERFFEGDPINVHDLYSENSKILEEMDDDRDVDLSSYALQIWNNATAAQPQLKDIIPRLPDVVYSCKASTAQSESGVIVYAKTALNNDVLTWLNSEGEIITQSQFTILNAALCSIDTPLVPRAADHHELVAKGMGYIKETTQKLGGQLGHKNGVRYRLYERLNRYYTANKNGLFENLAVQQAIDDLYNYPLKEYAQEIILRRLKLDIDDNALASLVLSLRAEDQFCHIDKSPHGSNKARIICSLGIV